MSIFPYQELYDHRGDKAENYSVAEGHPEVAQAMKARLDAAKATFAPYRHKDIPQAFKTLQAQLAHIQD
jgi:arylsulfatase A